MQHRNRKLLKHEEIAGNNVPDNIVRSLWLGRLPSFVQAILAMQAKADLITVAVTEAIPQRQNICEYSTKTT